MSEPHIASPRQLSIVRIKKRLAGFIPITSWRRRLRRKYKELIASWMIKEHIGTNEIIYPARCRRSIEIHVEGKNNRVYVGHGLTFPEYGKLRIFVCGTNNSVNIGDSATIHGEKGVTIRVGEFYHMSALTNASVNIGSNCHFVSVFILVVHANSSVNIGSDCMFSHDIIVRHSDGHPIYEQGTRNIINKVNTINIGNHVWVGYNAHILKNVQIADNCIIGCNAVVTKSFLEPYCAIAGNPAKIVRKAVDWEFDQTMEYIANAS